VDFIRDALSKVENDTPSCCAIRGMPGIGKSQLVLHYSKISFDSGRYFYVFWVSATSIDKLNQGLSKILELVGHPDRYLRDQTAQLTAARLWLEEPHEDWLLIFDNVDRSTVDFIRAHMPRRNARGHILFTTRTTDVAETLANFPEYHISILQLRALQPRVTANLLLDQAGITPTPSLLEQAEEVVECVGRLPLAVIHAASFMKHTQTTVDQMLQMYRSER
jgi:hypothetical protein